MDDKKKTMLGKSFIDEFILLLNSNPKSKKYKKIDESYLEVYNRLTELGWPEDKINVELKNKVDKELKNRGVHATLAIKKRKPKNKKMIAASFKNRKYVKSGDAKFFQGGSPGLGKRK